MSASITNLLLLTQFQVTENPGSGPSGVQLTSFFNEVDQLVRLSPTSTPAATLFGVYKTAISGSGYTIDATSLQGSNGLLNATGKKLVAIALAHPAASAGDVSVSTGATNGYALPATLTCKPGGFAILYHAAHLANVDSTHKTFDITGTSGDTPEIALVWG
jgi:hypothetical protein